MDNKLRVSKNLTAYDVQYDELAVRLGLQNLVPNEEVLNNAVEVAEHILEPLFAAIPDAHITSWYRCPNLEKEYSRKSYPMWCIKNKRPIREQDWLDFLDTKQHHTGQRVCLRARDLTALFEFLKALPAFDTLEHKTHWISISYSDNNQKRVIHE